MKIYWVHQESGCVGIVDSKEKLWELMKTDPCVEECTEEQYHKFIEIGYSFD